MQRELPFDECIAMLEAHRFGRLGVRDADGVYIVPISYALAADVLYAHAPPGHKVQLMRLWPHVAFEIDEIEDTSHWRSVLVRAHVEELTDDASREECRLRLLAAAGGAVSAVTAGHGHRVHLADATLFRLRIQGMTGRAESW